MLLPPGYPVACRIYVSAPVVNRSWVGQCHGVLTRLELAVLSVDLRDAVGDRLYLSSGFRRDGTLFDIGQATALKEHAAALSARQAVAQSRKSRGFFSTLFRKSVDGYRPTFNHQPSGGACRIYGSIPVKKVTGKGHPARIAETSDYCTHWLPQANLHITTLGHGYASHQHVDHKCDASRPPF